MSSLQDYFSQEANLLSRIDFNRVDQVIRILDRARREGHTVFLFGNGGSASTSSHFACDLAKGTALPGLTRMKVLALNDNIPTFSAYANDVGYDSVFAEQLLSLAAPGDIAIAFSGSGNSPNVLRGMEIAQQRGLATIGFTGFEGGKLKERVQLEVNVPARLMGQIEDVHLSLTHAICEMLKIQHG